MRRERGREKEGEKIENQNEEDFINGAADPWLFIHGITKEDFEAERPAKFPTTTMCLLAVLLLIGC